MGGGVGGMSLAWRIIVVVDKHFFLCLVIKNGCDFTAKLLTVAVKQEQFFFSLKELPDSAATQ